MCKTSKAGQIQSMVHNALTSDERSRFLWRTDSVWIWTLLVLIREARRETWRNWEMEKTCQLSLWSEKYSHHQYLSKLWNDPIRQKRGQTLYQLLFGLPKFQFRLVYNWRLNLKSKCSNFVQNLQFSPVLSIRVSKYLSCACCRTTSHAHYITETGPLIDPETTARSNTFPVSNWVSESLPRIKIQWQGKGVPGSHELRPGHVFRLD